MESFAASWLFQTLDIMSLYIIIRNLKIQKENEVCICDFGALKTHILNFSSATMKSVYFF